MDNLNNGGSPSEFYQVRSKLNSKINVSKEEIENMKNTLDKLYLLSNNNFESTALELKDKLTAFLDTLVPVDLIAFSLEIKKILAEKEESALNIILKMKV
jgi:hypothetical protein